MPEADADRTALLVGVDPGRAKCGVAVLTGGPVPRLIRRAVTSVDNLPEEIRSAAGGTNIAEIILGSGTASTAVATLLRGEFPNTPVVFIDETDSTLEARRRYLREHPPRGLARLLPPGLRVPAEPVDGYVAEILIERHLTGRRMS